MLVAYKQHLSVQADKLMKRAHWKVLKDVLSCMRTRCITKRHLHIMMTRAVAHWNSASIVAIFFAWVDIGKVKKKLCHTVGFKTSSMSIKRHCAITCISSGMLYALSLKYPPQNDIV